MITYLQVTFKAEGIGTKELTERLEKLEFVPCLGEYDYEHDWKEEAPSIFQIMSLVDRVRNSLTGSNVDLKFKTEK